MNQKIFERKTLGPLLTLKKGKKPISQSPTKEKGTQPYVDIKAFETGVIDNYTDDDKCVPCNEGDLLIVCDGSRSGYVGRAIKGYTGSTLAKISAEGVDNSYLYYFIQSMYRLLNTQMKGTGTPHLNVEVLRKAELVIPSISEQKRIVNKIEELFSELDSAVETLKKTKEQLSVYRQSVLTEMFNGSYSKVRLDEISKVINGYAFKSKLYSSDGEYVVVKIGNVKQFKFDFSRDFTKTTENSEQILSRYLLKDGDCLITLTGSRGKRDYGFVVMIDGQRNYLLNQRVAALRFDKEKVFPKFFQYYLSSPNYRNQFFSYETGNVGQGNVGVKALSEPMVICPSKDMQKHIVTEIEQKMSVCDSIEQSIDLGLRQADAMRQSILKKAFEGEL